MKRCGIPKRIKSGGNRDVVFQKICNVGILSINGSPISREIRNCLCGKRVTEQGFQQVRIYSYGVDAGHADFMNLFYILKACGQYLGRQIVKVEQVRNIARNTGTVADNIIQTIDIRCDEIRAGTCADLRLLLGEDGGRRDLDPFFL